MWIRKTVEELNTSKARKDRSSAFLPILMAGLFTGVAIVRSAPDPGTTALIFLLVLYSAFAAKATWAILTSDSTDPGYSQQDLEFHLFCPDCGSRQSHAALCSVCRGPLEPMAHWKWVPDSEKLVSTSFEETSPWPQPDFFTTAPPIGQPELATRTIPLALPTKRMILAAKIGVDEFRILKDLMDENLFAAINPRISDRNALTNLGRKYRVAFRFVT